ncbi:urease accessory protein UreE [Natrinema sp. DC36]|uniref:urease accessory protein UreE n=1 Tax=Natrinema sp. DC36 TaxID=2878680 RepID=UPI001CEFD15A|nr:urease accessory protein UreE [Natrinema sp. DC36]
MERIDGIVGNVHADDDLAALYADHESAGTLERVVIDADDRRRSRFRATTDAGTDVGVVVDKAAVSAGDVLLAEDDRLIVVAFEPRDALVVSLPDATAERLEAAVELGHRIGNQHWDLAIDDGDVYVPLEADRHIVERVVADVVPGSEIRETTVEADLFVTDLEDADPGGARGVNHGSEHGHGHGSGHGHGHENGHSHDHDHAHGRDHTHEQPHDSRHDH